MKNDINNSDDALSGTGPHSSTVFSENPFEIVANYTYDWETWFSPDGQVQWINPAVQRMTGYSIDDCLAMQNYPAELVHCDDRERIMELLMGARTGTSGNDVEFKFHTKAGKTGWAAVSWQQMRNGAGQSLGFRTSMREISERKKAEAVLRVAMAEAERANAAKTRFLAAVSHDLRQPLQAIAMFIATLQSSPPKAQQAEILDDVQFCLESCNELLDDLLDISRLDAGAVTPNISDVCIGDVLENLESSLSASVAEKSNELRVVYSSKFVKTDGAMVQRILQNLISNANRYTSGGRILLGCRMRATRLYIEVWDNGIGIAPAECDHIFEEFYQVGNPQRDRRKGVGLGLAIVKRLAHLLDADLIVRSWPGQGSVFALELLGSDETCVPASSPAQQPKWALNGHRVLIIDDEPMQRKSLRQMLAAFGADVIEAASARDAVSLCDCESSQLADAAVVDYRLADGLNGVDAIEAIRKKQGRALPAIIITGDTAPHRISEIEASGLVIMHKPVKAQALLDAIIGLL